MTTGELLRLNGLPSTYRIYSGQVRDCCSISSFRVLFYSYRAVKLSELSIEGATRPVKFLCLEICQFLLINDTNASITLVHYSLESYCIRKCYEWSSRVGESERKAKIGSHGIGACFHRKFEEF